MPIPSLGGQGSTMALGVPRDISSKQFMKYQTNKYLDAMNEQVFKPRGLYAAIMSFEPDSPHAGAVVDVTTNFVQAVDRRLPLGRGYAKRFRTSSGATRGETELPHAAPLEFPDLRDLPEHQRANR